MGDRAPALFGATDGVGAADVGAADVGAADVGAADVGAADVDAADVADAEADEVARAEDSALRPAPDGAQPATLRLRKHAIAPGQLLTATTVTKACDSSHSPSSSKTPGSWPEPILIRDRARSRKGN